MEHFQNTKELKIEDLRKSNMYPEDVIEKIENQDFSALENLISSSDRENRDFMEPLLYAVKNEYNTYIIFSFLGENLQNDVELALEIIKEEPELIKGTPLSKNKQFILESASINPEVVKYMAPELESDKTFIVDLYKKNNLEITRYIQNSNSIENLITENKDLINDKAFMVAAVAIDAEALKYASSDLKSDKEFIEKACKNNHEVIGYIASHTDEFQKDGLESAKNVLVDVSSNDAISGFKDESNRIKELIEKQSDNNSTKEDLEALLKRDKQLQRHIKFFERIKNGEVDPVRAYRLISKVCANIEPRYKEQIENILSLNSAIVKKEKQEDMDIANLNSKKAQITLEDISDITGSVKLSQVEEATKDIKAQVIQKIEKDINKGSENPDIGDK